MAGTPYENVRWDYKQFWLNKMDIRLYKADALLVIAPLISLM